MSMKPPLTGIALALALAGCMLGPDYHRPALDVPANYPPSQAPAPAQAPLAEIPADWWTLYQDATLTHLVETGLTRNTDMKLAAARIEEAEGLLREAGAVRFPLIEGNGSAARGRTPSQTASGPSAQSSTVRNTYVLTAGTTFELDFWGRLRRAQESARAQYLATQYGRDTVALTLASSIVQTYFAARSLQAQTSVAAEMLHISDESLDIVRRRVQAGLISDLDLNQAESAQAEASAQLKTLQRQRDATIHQLGLLTGTPALQLDDGDVRALPIPPVPPAGLPATLLERRPDVRQAEAQLMAANAEIGVARADQFPTFSLTGAFGRQSAQLGSLFSAGSHLWSIGLGVVGPIFDAGRYAARTDQAVARQKQAAANYEGAMQSAFRDVADGLSNVAWTDAAEKDAGERVDRARNTLRLARVRYEAGYSAFLEVLDAQRTLNDAELDFVRNRQAHLAYTVDLMQALGGGWNAGHDPLAQAAN